MKERRVGAHLAAALLTSVVLLSGCDGAPESNGGGADASAPNAATDPSKDVPSSGVGRALVGPSLPFDIRRDPRVVEIPLDCYTKGPYVRDTADPIAILIDKLSTGDSEVLARAAEELGAMGARSVPALGRLVAEQLRDRTQVLQMQNTVRALALNPSDEATELLLVVLSHQDAALRQQALGVLAGRDLDAKHFELLRDAAMWEGGGGQSNALGALFAADPVRAAHQMLDWLLDGKVPVNEARIGPLLAVATDPGVLERMAAFAADVPPTYAPYTDMALYVAGDEAAVERTLVRLVDTDPDVRANVLNAAKATEQVEILRWGLTDDPLVELRATATMFLVDVLDGKNGDAAANVLVDALDDPEALVNRVALDALVRRRHPVAVDRALALLEGDRVALESILASLHQAMQEDQELSERARVVLQRRLESSEGLETTSDVVLLQALALCPGAATARAVLAIADATPPGMVIETISAHRYIAIQLANTGVAGRREVVARLNEEQDPERRLDLMWTIGAHRDDLAREALAHMVEDDALDPWERVYAAHLLTRVGPTATVAPLLKAAARRFEGEPRRALDCLLHRWY
ncbi:hypothetical protein Pla163_20920 [Planctomycetes bacterium Pla163]|uniref:Uncharacterized protein n=1 Tax=Rohdeia mirabilis TaxID=2528008 RepID=A0A518D0G6_9BACT|nr:hypothetical protein Pla163_20920 [Planctomycetes bacterium Pla163]